MLTDNALVLYCMLLVLYVIWLEPQQASIMAYSLGFWDSCFGSCRLDATQGTVPPSLNKAATDYIASVYADTHLPRGLRRTQAVVTGLWVLLLYVFLIGIVVATKPTLSPALITLYVAWTVPFLISGALWLVTSALSKKQGVPLWRRSKAISALQSLKQSPIWTDLQSQIEQASPSVPVWWPYPQGVGPFFHNLWRILKLAVPIAIGTVAFLHGVTAHHGTVTWLFESFQLVWLTKLLIVLAFAVEWMWIAGCLIHWGDWKGATISTHRTFPLEVLLKDIVDLRI